MVGAEAYVLIACVVRGNVAKLRGDIAFVINGNKEYLNLIVCGDGCGNLNAYAEGITNNAAVIGGLVITVLEDDVVENVNLIGYALVFEIDGVKG